MQNREKHLSSQQCSQARKTISHPTYRNTDQNKPGPGVPHGTFRCYFNDTNKTQAVFNCRKAFTFPRTSVPQKQQEKLDCTN